MTNTPLPYASKVGDSRPAQGDAKWLSTAGKYSFNYGKMGNARVFLLALDKLMGYRWN